MIFRRIFLLYLQYHLVFSYRHEKPVPQSLWPDRCAKNQRLLNDCNWCHCDGGKFVCTARVCGEVDVFGHFKDTIIEHEVGMEGHGVWRSGNSTACNARAHYQRDGLLCVCDDDGNWPNPVCRDLFQILHEVEVAGHSRPSALHSCAPRKLYLYGCNVCFCPHTGQVDPALCTNNTCSHNDPVILDESEIKAREEKQELNEVYAECTLNRKYVVGCRKCICLKNNRLLCDNCERDEVTRSKDDDDHCSRHETGHIFNIECNVCVCDEKGTMYCTTKRCLKEYLKPAVELSKSVDLTLRSVEPPIDALECTPGTKYKKGCNVCYCTESPEGVKALSCTLKMCKSEKEILKTLANDCVENTVYEANCLVCRCDVVDGVKRESCLVESQCRPAGPKSQNLNDLHGYCEPAHTYRKDCNMCRCLSDGKTVACTARVCPRRSDAGPISVDIVPVQQPSAQPCPKNHMYKIDCNYCFCLVTGNLLCTTANCNESK